MRKLISIYQYRLVHFISNEENKRKKDNGYPGTSMVEEDEEDVKTKETLEEKSGKSRIRNHMPKLNLI